MSTSFKKGSWNVKLMNLFFHHLLNVQNDGRNDSDKTKWKQNKTKRDVLDLKKQSRWTVASKPNKLIKMTKTSSMAHSLICTKSSVSEAHRKLQINSLKVRHVLISIPYFLILTPLPSHLTFVVFSLESSTLCHPAAPQTQL